MYGCQRIRVLFSRGIKFETTVKIKNVIINSLEIKLKINQIIALHIKLQTGQRKSQLKSVSNVII